MNELYDVQYSYCNNDIKEDKKYFTDYYSKRGYKNIKVKKVRTDTVGLKMYEIIGEKDD